MKTRVDILSRRLPKRLTVGLSLITKQLKTLQTRAECGRRFVMCARLIDYEVMSIHSKQHVRPLAHPNHTDT